LLEEEVNFCREHLVVTLGDMAVGEYFSGARQSESKENNKGIPNSPESGPKEY
jgi:hypothetical protein